MAPYRRRKMTLTALVNGIENDQQRLKMIALINRYEANGGYSSFLFKKLAEHAEGKDLLVSVSERRKEKVYWKQLLAKVFPKSSR